MTDTILVKSWWHSSWNPVGLAVLELLLALCSGLALMAVGAGGGSWILSGIIAGAIVVYSARTYLGQAVTPNRNARKLGQMVTGLAIGLSVHQSQISQLSLQIPGFILIAGFLMASGTLIGYLYSRLEKVDLLTAVMATTPGNIGVMASIAADYGRNTALVSLVQLMRFTTIILLVPHLASVPHTDHWRSLLESLGDRLTAFDPLYCLVLVLVLGLTFATVRLGNRFQVPVAAFFCPILVGLIAAASLEAIPVTAAMHFSLPTLLKIVGQILLGTTIGEYWGVNPRLGKLTALRAIVPVALTFLAGAGAASIAHVWLQADWLTCLLVAAPGGSPEMIWIALVLNHNLELVTAGHLVRLLTINLLLPLLVSGICRLEDRWNTGPS